MNILIFSWRDIKHPNAGGAEQVMHEHAKGWVRAGHKVIHFSSKAENLLDSEVIDKVEFIRSGYQYLGVQLAGFFYYLKNRSGIDFVVDEFHGIPFLTPLYVRKPKLAVIQEVARKVWLLNPLPKPVNWIIGIIGFLGEPFVFLFYKKTHFMLGSDSAKEDVIKMGILPKNITIVPHGVIVPEISVLPKKEEKKTIVYLGKLSKDKGIEDALKCFSILNKRGEYQFWIIGKEESKSYFNQFKKLIKNLRLDGKVKFWGFVSQKKKFELLSRAYILVNPSVHEGWGLVNIEANRVGTPVVAYKVAGLVDSVNNGVSGILCIGNTPEDMAEIIEKLLRNSLKYQKLILGAVSWSTNFSWEKSRKLSLELINRLCTIRTLDY